MKSILVEASPEETRVAIVEDGELLSIEVERATHSHIVGNIYKGHVQNVLPGMQAAFVDIGQEKNAFLYIGDGRQHDRIASLAQPQRIHIGEYLPVQITKDAIGTKGPRATTHITLPGRNVVLMPTAAYVGISRRIESEAERSRLLDIAHRLCPEGMGLIVRTAAAGAMEEAMAADIRYLTGLWQSILAHFRLKSRGGILLYRDADLIIRTIRDSFGPDVDALIVDDRREAQRARELIEHLSPELADRVQLYEDMEPLFRRYGLDRIIESLSARQVELPSGGFLVIDKTEALTVIDVNTGSYVGQSNLADTVYHANIEAAAEILRQIRLRDIGGIIIIDFIDMEKETQKESLLAYLREHSRADRTKMNVVDITPLGLVEITRKKSRQNLAGIVYTECPVCQGRGYIESTETVSIRISRDIRQMETRSHAPHGYNIEVAPTVASELVASPLLLNLAAKYGTDIKVTAKPDLHPEMYSILSQS